MMKNICSYTAGAIILLVLLPSLSSAQMFSVMDELRGFERPTYSAHIGLELADFNYIGREDNVNESRYEFEGPIFRLQVESPNLHIYMGSGGRITGIDGASFFQVGLRARYLFPLIIRDRVSVILPFQLQSDMTTVTNTDVIDFNQFQQGIMIFSTGAIGEYQALEWLRFQVSVIPGGGLSFSSGGTFAGNVYAWEVGGRTYFDRVFGNVGLVAGYELKTRSFDVERERFDYDLTGHRMIIGFTF